jgi:3-oxoacyl-[acyl-carrier protein] reductase
MVVVITGTSKGLGLHMAKHYLNLKHLVYGCSRSNSSFNHSSYDHTILDLSNEVEVRSWIKKIKTNHKIIDVLICNAALVQSSLLFSVTPGNIMESFLKNNISGVFYVMREVSKMMISQRSGRIIAISSTTTAIHQEGTAVYSATKSAITEMIKVLSKEIASRDVTCNIIAPAMMITESSSDLAQNKEWENKMLKKQTIQKIISKEEVCHVSDFLISPLSSSITGQIIFIGLSN